MKKNTKNLLRTVISVLYLLWGVGAVVLAFKSLLTFNIGGILSAASGVIMFIAGLLGLLKTKPSVCRICAIITFVLAVISAFLHFTFGPVVTAVLAWLFILCL